jgi:hypothetical protein
MANLAGESLLSIRVRGNGNRLTAEGNAAQQFSGSEELGIL